MILDIQLQGGRELESQLMSLERNVAKKIIRKATREGLKPVLRAAKANARSMVGGDMGAKIARNLVLRAYKKQRKGSYAMAMRLKSEKEGAPRDFVHMAADGTRYYVPNAIEWGHAFPGRGGGKNPPKDVPAIPYMRQAADSYLLMAPRIMEKEIKRGIEAITRMKTITVRAA